VYRDRALHATLLHLHPRTGVNTMPTESRFDDLDLREEPARDSDRLPSFGSSGFSEICTNTLRCTRVCCTCPPALD